MKHAQRSFWRSQQWLTVCAVMPLLVGCPKQPSFTQEAESLYTYGPERDPINTIDPQFPGPVVDDDKAPHLKIATAIQDPGAPPREGRVIARIRSQEDYPQMGLRAGFNYVWRVLPKNGKDSVNQIFPAGAASMTHQLTRDPRQHEYYSGDPLEPRLIKAKVRSTGIGLCLDDDVCKPSGHCGYF